MRVILGNLVLLIGAVGWSGVVATVAPPAPVIVGGYLILLIGAVVLLYSSERALRR